MSWKKNYFDFIVNLRKIHLNSTVPSKYQFDKVNFLCKCTFTTLNMGMFSKYVCALEVVLIGCAGQTLYMSVLQDKPHKLEVHQHQRHAKDVSL